VLARVLEVDVVGEGVAGPGPIYVRILAAVDPSRQSDIHPQIDRSETICSRI
jgi:hypothetical protein